MTKFDLVLTNDIVSGSKPALSPYPVVAALTCQLQCKTNLFNFTELHVF